MKRICLVILALCPGLAQAATFVCDTQQFPLLLTLEIDRQTGACAIGGIEMVFRSADEDFVCLIPELGQTFLLAPDNTWAMFDEDSDVVYSGRCTPI